jgi:Family of unknown function (DUF6065)
MTGSSARPGGSAPSAPELVAYPVPDAAPMGLIAAPAGRGWMEATPARFANRCLPLLIANQSGWCLLLDRPVEAVWDGGAGPESLAVSCPGAPPHPASSVFGHGLLTFHVPFLFRTPVGWNLLVRGPANLPKDGIAPLEGVVESDWAVATFTMNWQLTRPGQEVRFESGEPVCMIVPQRRGELESFRPRIAPLAADPATERAYLDWVESRELYTLHRRLTRSRPGRGPWQKHYFLGTSPAGIGAPSFEQTVEQRCLRYPKAQPLCQGECQTGSGSAFVLQPFDHHDQCLQQGGHGWRGRPLAGGGEIDADRCGEVQANGTPDVGGVDQDHLGPAAEAPDAGAAQRLPEAVAGAVIEPETLPARQSSCRLRDRCCGALGTAP